MEQNREEVPMEQGIMLEKIFLAGKQK